MGRLKAVNGKTMEQRSGEAFQATPASLMALMVARLRLMGEATVADWEQEVFRAVTGRSRAEVDFDYLPNAAGAAYPSQHLVSTAAGTSRGSAIGCGGLRSHDLPGRASG